MSAATYTRATIKKQAQHSLVNGSTSQSVVSIYQAPVAPTITKISGYINMKSTRTASGTSTGGIQWVGAVGTSGNYQTGFTVSQGTGGALAFNLGTLQYVFPSNSDQPITVTSNVTAGTSHELVAYLKDFVVPAGYYFQVQNNVTYNNTTTYSLDYYLTVTTEQVG